MKKEMLENILSALKEMRIIGLDSRRFTWTQVNRCQAWFTEYGSFTVLRSYSTLVAFYSKPTNELYIIGRYNRTTYQHVRKFTVIVNPDTVYNLELEKTGLNREETS